MAQRLKFDERWVNIDGIRTRYLLEGDGDPVVFVHGGHFGDTSSAESGEVWNLNIPEVAKHYTCIALDRLGQGFTQIPQCDEDYTMAASVQHAAAFIRTTARHPCHVVGHSRGGYVAARLTADHPELIRSCTIISSNTLAIRPGSNEIVFAGNPHPPFSRERSLYVLERYSYSLNHVEEPWLDIRVKALQSENYRAGAARMADRALYLTQFSPGLEADRRDLHARIARNGLQRPTLVVWSRNDLTAPVTMALELFQLLAKKEPRTELHLLNGAGHYCYRERAREFNRTLLDFLTRT
jgi:2-hydroxy-6-oxonona-2,4-dienedioate hydrolase